MTEGRPLGKPIPKGVADIAFIGVDLMLLAIILQIARFFPSLESIANFGLLGIPIGLIVQLIAYFQLAKEWEDNKTKALVIAYAFSLGSSSLLIVIFGFLVYISLPETIYTQQTDIIEFTKVLSELEFSVIFMLFLVYVMLVGDGLLFYLLHKRLHEVSGIKEFKTSGLLMRIGTILLIVGIGILLIIASLGLQILLWTKIKGQYEQDSF